MQLSDQQFISAPPAEVYAALNDSDILKRCIPGCDTLEKKSDTEFAATVTLKIGPVKAKFSSDVVLSNLNPPREYTISGKGSAGAAGAASGSADVKLQEQDNGTLLVYTVNVQISGKIAQLGSRLIDATAKKLAGQFFENFAAALAPPEDVATEEQTAAPAEAKNEVKSQAQQPNSNRQLIIAAVVFAVIAIAAATLL